MFGRLKKKMGAGNDGGYIDLTFTSTQRIIFLLITDEKRETSRREFRSFRVVEEEPKRRLCPEAQSLSLMAFQRKARLLLLRWIIGG